MKLSLLLFTQGDSGWRQPGFSRAGGSLAFVLAKVQAKESSALRQNWLLQCFSVWTDQWSVEFLFQWMATVGHVDRLPSWIDTLGSQICWWGWYMKLYEPLRYVEPPTSCFNPASQRLKCFGTKQTRQPWFKIWRHHLIFMHDGPTCCVETHLLNWNLWDKLLPVVFAICNDPHPVAWHLWFPGQGWCGWLLDPKGCLVWKIKGLVTNLYGAWTKPELTQFQPTLIGQGKLQWTQHSCCLMPPNTPGFSSFVLFHSQGCDCWVTHLKYFRWNLTAVFGRKTLSPKVRVTSWPANLTSRPAWRVAWQSSIFVGELAVFECSRLAEDWHHLSNEKTQVV